MATRRGGDANIPGLHRDPMDFKGVDRELRRGRGEKIAPPPSPTERVKLTVNMIAGFAWTYLAKHYDKFTPTERAPGVFGWSPFHVSMWEMVCSDHPSVAIAAPRGHAKSTSITLAYGLANLLFHAEDYVLIVSDTFEGQAVEIIREYARELTENEELIKDFRVKKLVKNVEGDIIIKFEDGNYARVKALGREGAVRGLRWRGKRPGLIILDDIEDPELAESKQRRDKSRNWVMKDLIQAGSLKGAKVRMVGTILHDDATLARFIRSSSWFGRVYRAHKAFNDFSNILWPEAWPEEKLRAKRQEFMDDNNSDGYSQEYLNDPVSPVDSYFKMEDVLAMEERDLATYGEYYIGWDFAVSKDEKADYSVATVWKIGDIGPKFVVSVIRGRWDAKEIIDKMFELEEDYHPQLHFVEKGTIEKALGPFLDTEMLTREVNINLHKITRNKDKGSFAKPLQAMVKKHDVLFNKSMAIWGYVEEELRRFLKSGHDDIVDGLSIVAQGLREITFTRSTEEREEEEYFTRLRDPQNPLSSRTGINPTTGY